MTRTSSLRSAIFVAAILTACSSHERDDGETTGSTGSAIIGRVGEGLPLPAVDQLPPLRFNEVARIATHNSYWVDRDNVIEIQGSGTEQRLFDQLLFEHVRGLEIDLHRDDTTPRNWTVYHTDKQSNSLCSPLAECLKQLRMFHYAQPKHEAVTVVLELKELREYNFDDSHTPADLDAILEANLGDAMFRPRDLLAHCPGAPTMRACVASGTAWPTIDELRGKFIFTVIGNWRGSALEICQRIPAIPCSDALRNQAFGHGPAGWATYATWGNGVAERSAFPMRSLWTHFNDGTQPRKAWRETVDHDTLQRAIDASVFAQAEATKSDPSWDEDAQMLEDPEAFTKAGGVVRIDNAALPDWQKDVSENHHLQIVQLDAPWLRYHDERTLQSNRPLDPNRPVDESLNEPGERLMMAATRKKPGRAFAWLTAPASQYSQWSTLAVGTRTVPNDDTHKANGALLGNPRRFRGKGCLRATTDPHDPKADAFAVCRQAANGAWNVQKPLDQDAVITVEVTKNGSTNVSTYYSNNNTAGGPGDILGLTVWANPSCATASSASSISANGQPAFAPLGDTTTCFSSQLLYQGIAAEEGDVLFAGTRYQSGTVRGTQLQGPERATTDASMPADGGYSLIDMSWPAPSIACSTNPQGNCTAAVHRTAGNGQHLYATDIWTGTSWGQEAEAKNYFYVEASPSSGRVPFNRCWSKATNHTYMRLSACDGDDSGSTLGYAATSPLPGTIPLFRARAASDDLLTTSHDEAVQASQYGYAYDTIACYVWSQAGSPTAAGLVVTKLGDGDGSVTSSPAGIACGASCGATLPVGTNVTLTAAPVAGSMFSGWSGACSGNAPTCTVALHRATTVSASFYIVRCAPKACGARQTCGEIDDGCGSTTKCGTCGSGQICTQSNACVETGSKAACLDDCEVKFTSCTRSEDAQTLKTCVGKHTSCVDACNCVPKTCASLSLQCGSADDGCHGTLSCGGCGADQACSNGACVCVPSVTSCDGRCGRVANGCGGYLTCPSCTCTPSCSGKKCGQSDGCGGSCSGPCGKGGDVCRAGDDGRKLCQRGD